MPNIEISSAGASVKWAVESTAGTRPTTGYTALVGVTSVAAANEALNMLQTTKLSALKSHTAIFGLNSYGLNAQAVNVNDYESFRTSWDAMVSAYETAKADGKALWIEYAYPAGSNLDSFFYAAEPGELGFGGWEVDSVVTNVCYLAMVGEPSFETAST